MRQVVLMTCALTLSLLISAAQQSSVGDDSDWKGELIDDVSGHRIMESVVELEALGTRDFHTEESREAALIIKQWMDEIGLTTSVQEFTADGMVITNVIGTLNGEDNEPGVLLFGAHYDSRNRYATTVPEAENVSAPGADDNASGIGAMLEIARVLAGCERYEATTRFVAFGAEERGFIDTDGLFGSNAYVQKEASLGVDYEATFILDMIGFPGWHRQRDDGGSRQRVVGGSGMDLLVGTRLRLGLDVEPTEELLPEIQRPRFLLE